MEKYIAISWPESQELMDKEGFESHSYLINDDRGLEDFGSQAYFVDELWYDRVQRLKGK